MLFILVALLAAGLDQAFKYFIIEQLSGGGQISLLPGIVHLTYLENDGAAFSSFSGMRWILSGVSLVCIIILIIVIFRSKMGGFGKLLLALIMGGALGNLIDRVLKGYVVDMFELEFFRFPVFNIADIFITVGCVIFVIYYLCTAPKGKKKSKAAEPEAKTETPVKSATGPAPAMEAAQTAQPVQDAADSKAADPVQKAPEDPSMNSAVSQVKEASGAPSETMTAREILGQYALDRILDADADTDDPS